jgi:hypothetical protein
MSAVRRAAVVAAVILAAFPAAAFGASPDWLIGPRILVPGDLRNQDCRTGVCKHNENTDLTRWRGDIYLVHRTAGSQILGPNSSLRVYRSRDEGRSFKLRAPGGSPARAALSRLVVLKPAAARPELAGGLREPDGRLAGYGRPVAPAKEPSMIRSATAATTSNRVSG